MNSLNNNNNINGNNNNMAAAPVMVISPEMAFTGTVTDASGIQYARIGGHLFHFVHGRLIAVGGFFDNGQPFPYLADDRYQNQAMAFMMLPEQTQATVNMLNAGRIAIDQLYVQQGPAAALAYQAPPAPIPHAPAPAPAPLTYTPEPVQQQVQEVPTPAVVAASISRSRTASTLPATFTNVAAHHRPTTRSTQGKQSARRPNPKSVRGSNSKANLGDNESLTPNRRLNELLQAADASLNKIAIARAEEVVRRTQERLRHEYEEQERRKEQEQQQQQQQQQPQEPIVAQSMQQNQYVSLQQQQQWQQQTPVQNAPVGENEDFSLLPNGSNSLPSPSSSRDDIVDLTTDTGDAILTEMETAFLPDPPTAAPSAVVDQGAKATRRRRPQHRAIAIPTADDTIYEIASDTDEVPPVTVAPQAPAPTPAPAPAYEPYVAPKKDKHTMQVTPGMSRESDTYLTRDGTEKLALSHWIDHEEKNGMSLATVITFTAATGENGPCPPVAWTLSKTKKFYNLTAWRDGVSAKAAEKDRLADEFRHMEQQMEQQKREEKNAKQCADRRAKKEAEAEERGETLPPPKERKAKPLPANVRANLDVPYDKWYKKQEKSFLEQERRTVTGIYRPLNGVYASIAKVDKLAERAAVTNLDKILKDKKFLQYFQDHHRQNCVDEEIAELATQNADNDKNEQMAEQMATLEAAAKANNDRTANNKATGKKTTERKKAERTTTAEKAPKRKVGAVENAEVQPRNKKAKTNVDASAARPNAPMRKKAVPKTACRVEDESNVIDFDTPPSPQGNTTDEGYGTHELSTPEENVVDDDPEEDLAAMLKEGKEDVPATAAQNENEEVSEEVVPESTHGDATTVEQPTIVSESIQDAPITVEHATKAALDETLPLVEEYDELFDEVPPTSEPAPTSEAPPISESTPSRKTTPAPEPAPACEAPESTADEALPVDNPVDDDIEDLFNDETSTHEPTPACEATLVCEPAPPRKATPTPEPILEPVRELIPESTPAREPTPPPVLPSIEITEDTTMHNVIPSVESNDPLINDAAKDLEFQQVNNETEELLKDIAAAQEKANSAINPLLKTRAKNALLVVKAEYESKMKLLEALGRLNKPAMKINPPKAPEQEPEEESEEESEDTTMHDVAPSIEEEDPLFSENEGYTSVSEDEVSSDIDEPTPPPRRRKAPPPPPPAAPEPVSSRPELYKAPKRKFFNAKQQAEDMMLEIQSERAQEAWDKAAAEMNGNAPT
ncbi:hypothetical protein EJ08DRAFT_649470 [Tothia fuscella]|uniref:Uncharacterized protein n=1 Tax=Tothia fuscella TaxID=1048955 RepID=A0A9P4NRB3_9PEZI|nr:hypothetical protein EJ08DRAFT_649470 [Tothia fuscella]